MCQRRSDFIVLVDDQPIVLWPDFCCLSGDGRKRSARDSSRMCAFAGAQHVTGIRPSPHPPSPQNCGKTSIGRERAYFGIAPRSVVIHVLGVDYVHTVTEAGGDLYLTDRGFPVRRAPAARELVRV